MAAQLTTSAAPKAKKARTPKRQLQLFVVTIPWNPDSSLDGDYQTKTWAVDDAAAISNVAQEMSEQRDSGCHSAEDKKVFVRRLVDHGGDVYAVADRMLNSIAELLMGPTRTLSKKAKTNYDAIERILVPFQTPR
jgi:hypothetical protein